MAFPIVSWRNEDNTQEVTSWNIGTVDAGSVSSDFIVLIWNNYKGADPAGDQNLIVSDMQNVVITTKDVNGGNNGELVQGCWINAKNITMNETEFTSIGGDTIHPIKTDQSTTNGDGTWTPGVAPHTTDNGTVDILGVWNDGNLENAKGNYIKMALHANVPAAASAGVVHFLTRVSYQYV